MSIEIERKFLVTDRWQPSGPGAMIIQGYLCTVPERIVRVRIADDVAFITVKGIAEGFARPEFEYSVQVEDAKKMMKLCEQSPIIKRRREVRVSGHNWVVDVFEGANAGLVIGELELRHEGETFVMPLWAGQEVSTDRRFANSCLVLKPFSTW